uniref:Uncharacterized protein n=1 Tax=Oryza glumipatula TaxID=40148 RepID=A0A0E0B471_9ORYZ
MPISDTFRNLKQYSSVDAYIDKVEEVMALDHIKRPLKSLHIHSLVDAYEHARNYDVPPRISATIPIYVPKDTSKQYVKQPGREERPTTASLPAAAPKSFGKCFRCGDPWVPGHGKICKASKQIYLVTLEDDTEETPGYDIIFGCDWIYLHSPLSLNLKTRELTIFKDGTTAMTLPDITIPPSTFLVNAHQVTKLLHQDVVGDVLYCVPLDCVPTTTSVTPQLVPDREEGTMRGGGKARAHAALPLQEGA